MKTIKKMGLLLCTLTIFSSCVTIQSADLQLLKCKVAIGFAIVIALIALIVVTLLVLIAAKREPPEIEEIITLPNPSDEWLKTSYNATTSLFIETDREIWQIATIFLSASLLIMGWVVTNLDKLDISVVIVAGCASVLLVGIATLFKHRLRLFNLVHSAYLRRLENAIMKTQDMAEYWGPHHLRNNVLSTKDKGLCPWLLSIHGIMDIYFVLFTAIWVALWIIKCFG